MIANKIRPWNKNMSKGLSLSWWSTMDQQRTRELTFIAGLDFSLNAKREMKGWVTKRQEAAYVSGNFMSHAFQQKKKFLCRVKQMFPHEFGYYWTKYLSKMWCIRWHTYTRILFYLSSFLCHINHKMIEL